MFIDSTRTNTATYLDTQVTAAIMSERTSPMASNSRERAVKPMMNEKRCRPLKSSDAAITTIWPPRMAQPPCGLFGDPRRLISEAACMPDEGEFHGDDELMHFVQMQSMVAWPSNRPLGGPKL